MARRGESGIVHTFKTWIPAVLFCGKHTSAHIFKAIWLLKPAQIILVHRIHKPRNLAAVHPVNYLITYAMYKMLWVRVMLIWLRQFHYLSTLWGHLLVYGFFFLYGLTLNRIGLQRQKWFLLCYTNWVYFSERVLCSYCLFDLLLRYCKKIKYKNLFITFNFYFTDYIFGQVKVLFVYIISLKYCHHIFPLPL